MHTWLRFQASPLKRCVPSFPPFLRRPGATRHWLPSTAPDNCPVRFDDPSADDESAADYMRGEDVFTREPPRKRQRQFRAAAEAMGKLLELNKVHLFLGA